MKTKGTVFLVDDDPSVRKGVSRLLSTAGYAVEVFAHLLTGKLNKQIGAEIGITEKTVKYHRANVLRKFGVTSTIELARIAGKLGLAP